MIFNDCSAPSYRLLVLAVQKLMELDPHYHQQRDSIGSKDVSNVHTTHLTTSLDFTVTICKKISRDVYKFEQWLTPTLTSRSQYSSTLSASENGTRC